MGSAKELYQEIAELEIYWNDTLEAVEMQYSGFMEGEEYREGLNKGLELLKKRNSQNWYADLRDLGTVTQEDQEWTSEEWFPRAISAGLTNMAIVRPESVIADMSVDNIVNEFEGSDLVMRNFGDPDEAKQWIREP